MDSIIKQMFGYEQYENSTRNRIDSCVFISTLTPFERFVIFRYSYGSGSINKILITGTDAKKRIQYWFKKTIDIYQFDKSPIPDILLINEMARQSFEDPEFYSLLDPELKLEISRFVILKFITILQGILYRAPILDNDVLVYRSSRGPYDKLAEGFIKDGLYPQKSFLSTTYKYNINNTGFIGDNCCYFILKIPKGSRTLHVPLFLHAYPFEDDRILSKYSEKNWLDFPTRETS